MPNLTPSQLSALTLTERITSSLSLLGFLFIVLTYSFAHAHFNKPINRLIFYAAWSNLGTTIAGLIAHAGMDGAGGPDGVLCQFQGWVIQMCMGELRLFFFDCCCVELGEEGNV